MLQTVITTPAPTARQVSGADTSGQWQLSVLAKRTYQVLDDGRCVLAEEQVPLQEEPVVGGDPGKERLLQDTDLMPQKQYSDVIVKGSARVATPAEQWVASVYVEQTAKHILVVGKRKCLLTAGGEVRFTRPEPIGEVPLQYDFAFGGRDLVAERRFEHPLADAPLFLPATMTPEDLHQCVYPRNPAGVGYLVDPNPEAVDQLALPNLEDLEDRLTPERLILGDPDRWPILPIPQATEWMHYEWFPRIAFLGMIPNHSAESGTVREVQLGFGPPDLMKLAPPWEKVDFRACNGASIGLRLPHLGGVEAIGLVNVHPRVGRFAFRLPGERPRIWTDGRQGKLNETDPVIHTVLIEPDKERVTIVWRGSASARRPYFPQELETMPFRVQW